MPSFFTQKMITENDGLWQTIQSKIKSIEDAAKLISIWRLKNDRIVFTNGCFDILHPGHAKYLADARSLGERLIVGLNSDESVRRLKGSTRPIQDENSRSLVLASLHAVDCVILFSDDTPEKLIRLVKPDYLVKGGDWSLDQIIGADFVKENGGKVLTIPFLEGYSTSNIEQKIKQSGGNG